MTIVEGGRRARRGFAYQDHVTLLDCLELGTLYAKVSFEDAEDIVCLSLDGACVFYRQVKTREGGGRQSASTITSPDKKDKIETSILGKLFTKPETTLVERFTLVVNEEPQPNLKGFCCDRETRPSPSAEDKTLVIGKLGGLALPKGCTIAKRVDGLEIIVEGRRLEDVKGKLIKKLNARVHDRFGVHPFFSDLEEILDRLLAEVARDALAVVPKEWTAKDFAALLDRIITQVTGRREDGAEEPLPTLSKKLEAACLPEAEILAQYNAWFRYRREQRSAIGKKRDELNNLNDEVHAVTVEINAQRRAGTIADGPASYAATIEAMGELSARLGTSRARTQQALIDVTARCQNRYRDE